LCLCAFMGLYVCVYFVRGERKTHRERGTERERERQRERESERESER